MAGPRFYDARLERLPRRELERLQLRRLRKAVLRASRVPFFARKLKERDVRVSDIRSAADIRRLPFTTKQDLRDHYPFGLAAAPLHDIVEVHATSGTTGVPVIGLYTRGDVESWGEVAARSLVMSGLTAQDVLQITPSFGMFTGGFGFFHGAQKVGSLIVPTGAGNSRRQLQFMRDFGTTMVCAVVSYALRLAEVAREMGLDPVKDTKVRKGVFGSEIWTHGMKRKIAQTWDMDVYDIYGLTELCGPGVANDCYRHDGMHVWEDHFLVEVIDPKTDEPLPPEQEGELVFTPLTKEAMPLLRYRTRDLAALYDSAICDCGRTHRRISSIKGRVDDMVKVSGVMIWPAQVEHTLLRHTDVGPEYQIVLRREKGVDQLLIRVEVEDSLDEKRRAALVTNLVAELRESLWVSPMVEFVKVGSLPRVEVGKAKRVVDERAS